MELQPSGADSKLSAEIRGAAIGLCRSTDAKQASRRGFETMLKRYQQQRSEDGAEPEAVKVVESDAQRMWASCVALRERANRFHVPRNLIAKEVNEGVCYEAIAAALKEPDLAAGVNKMLPPSARF